jgi:hypothetical protein
MAMTAMCPGCGKQLNVRDELLGKRLKCPGCGNTFTADATTAAPMGAAPAATRPVPGSARGRDPRAARTPKLHVSPGVIIFALVTVSLPTIFFVWRVGPGKVRAEWAKLEPIASEDVKDIVTRAIQSYISQHGGFDPSKSHQAPHGLDITFVFSPLPWSMPQRVGFAGTSTQGAFSGNYRPGTGEVEAKVEVGGFALQGAGVARRGDVTLNVTGRNKNGVVTVEIDGKPAELVYPKRDED